MLGTACITIAPQCCNCNVPRVRISKTDRKFALESAIKEDKFTLRECPASDPFYAVVVTHLGMVYAEQGDVANAQQAFDQAIESNPSYHGAYIAKSICLKKKGDAALALETLVVGSEATGGQSAELENALGLAYCDKKQYEQAREHARKAYALGYPLPGLRDKLAKAGFPL